MSGVLWIVMNETQTVSYWVLRWKDGTYYCKGSSSGWDTIEGTTDIQRAERFVNEECARNFHDGMGHFYHQRMHAVPVRLEVLTGNAVELPAREHSIWDDREKWCDRD